MSPLNFVLEILRLPFRNLSSRKMKPMSRKKSILGALKWDLVLLGLIVLGVGLVVALEHPHFEPATSEKTTGSRPPDRIEGDVLLLLPDSPAAAAHDLGELDCSYGWYN